MNVESILDVKGSKDVLAMPAGTKLVDFVRQACEHDIGAMLVTDEKGEIAGIVTERDILHQCDTGVDFNTVPVEAIMSRDLVTVQVDDDINTAMDYMITMRIRHLPVLDGKEVAGIITIRDLILAMRKADDQETRILVEYLQKSLKERKG